MLFQNRLPQKFWVESYSTANFLVNLLPSSVTKDHRSPYEVLNWKALDYSSLRVFGCACFPILRDYSGKKIDLKSLKCVFLGYNDKYKGYKFLYPPTGHVYISRHVAFDENQFPFFDIYRAQPADCLTILIKAWQKSFHVQQPPENCGVAT